MRRTSRPAEVRAAYFPFSQGKAGSWVKFRRANGEARGLSYFDLQEVDYRPALGIVLESAHRRVMLEGRNLEGLFDDLLDQRVAEIHERHANDARLAESDVYIDQISWERLS